jgi:hypothetical protein
MQRGECTALKDKVPVRPAKSNHAWHDKRIRARVFETVNGEEVPVHKGGTIYVNPNKASPHSLPYIIQYDDPEESDEEVHPKGPEDHIELLHVEPSQPDPEKEYRGRLRSALRIQGLILIHSNETQPDKEITSTGAWTLTRSACMGDTVERHVIEVHDPRGKWVGDILPERATILLEKFTEATRDSSTHREMNPGTFPHEIGLLLLRYQSGKKSLEAKELK